jgi:hypothetical protein
MEEKGSVSGSVGAKKRGRFFLMGEEVSMSEEKQGESFLNGRKRECEWQCGSEEARVILNGRGSECKYECGSEEKQGKSFLNGRKRECEWQCGSEEKQGDCARCRSHTHPVLVVPTGIEPASKV